MYSHTCIHTRDQRAAGQNVEGSEGRPSRGKGRERDGGVRGRDGTAVSGGSRLLAFRVLPSNRGAGSNTGAHQDEIDERAGVGARYSYMYLFIYICMYVYM